MVDDWRASSVPKLNLLSYSHYIPAPPMPSSSSLQFHSFPLDPCRYGPNWSTANDRLAHTIVQLDTLTSPLPSMMITSCHAHDNDGHTRGRSVLHKTTRVPNVHHGDRYCVPHVRFHPYDTRRVHARCVSYRHDRNEALGWAIVVAPQSTFHHWYSHPWTTMRR